MWNKQKYFKWERLKQKTKENKNGEFIYLNIHINARMIKALLCLPS